MRIAIAGEGLRMCVCGKYSMKTGFAEGLRIDWSGKEREGRKSMLFGAADVEQTRYYCHGEVFFILL